MMSKKRKMMIGVVVAVAIIVGVTIIFTLTKNQHTETSLTYTLEANVENTSSAWIINITAVVPHGRVSKPYPENHTLYKENVHYLIAGNISENFNNTPLTEIDGKPYEQAIYYNVTWMDNDNNDRISIGDTFIISKTRVTGEKIDPKAGPFETRFLLTHIGAVLLEVILP